MFFITLLHPYTKPRCVAYEPLEWMAISTAKNHIGNESYYDNLVIEHMLNGVHPDVLKEIWFEWTEGTWKEIEKPIWAKGTTNWAIG